VADFRADDRAAAPEASALFFEIAHCENVKVHFSADAAPSHPCWGVIATQAASSVETFQVPEPWCGDLEAAPILFVSSNPSIGDDSHALWFAADRDLWDSHVNLFFGERWTLDGIYTVLPDGSRSKNWVRYWAAVRARAGELLGREATPGRDYALTEVVHCKSRGELGVPDAQPECAARYLRRTLSLSTAPVVIGFGDVARRSMVDTFEIDASQNVIGPAFIAGRERIVLCLPHPNARCKRSVRDFVSPEDLLRIRDFIGA
jgi:hypothetical protein